jgi:hypothetical protein
MALVFYRGDQFAPRLTPPSVSIRGSEKSIFINAALAAQIPKTQRAALLGYDESNSTIVIKFVSGDDATTQGVHTARDEKRKGYTGFVISASGFLQYLEWTEKKKTLAFEAVYSASQKTITIYLNKQRTVVK